MRVVPKLGQFQAACLSTSAPTAAGCKLSRFQCNAGVLSCGVATDVVCNQCNDFDGDGFDGADPVFCAAGRDCNDSDAQSNPHADEICDGYDNDCDDLVDIKDDQAYFDYWNEVRPAAAADCPTGTKCGPKECAYNLTCICPTGPGPNCRCGEGLEEEPNMSVGEPETALSADGPSNDDAGFEDPQAACASAPVSGKSSSVIFAWLLLGLAWGWRRRRGV